MGLLEIAAVALIVVIAAVVAVFGRREFFVRTHGAVQLAVRLHQRPDGGGWAPGFALYRGDELRWYRLFSLALRPRRTLSRHGLSVESRRAPTAREAPLIPADWRVLRCRNGEGDTEIAMPRHAVNGFLSWLESVRPYST